MCQHFTFRCANCAYPIPQPRNYFEKIEFFAEETCSQCGHQITETHKVEQLKTQFLNSLTVNKPMQPIGRTL